jgi:hypothetical protein
VKGPCPEKLAHSIHPAHPRLAIDLLRGLGYTRGAAKRALVQSTNAEQAGEAATFAKDTNT